MTITPALLNLGCGDRINPNWVNVDFHPTNVNAIPFDLNQGIPFPDSVFDVVYHSHLLEHFPKEHAQFFLKDCFRVLKPNGIIRIVVTDLETIVRIYLLMLNKSLKGDVVAQQRYEWIILELFDQMVRNHSGGAMLDYWQRKPMPAENFAIKRMGSAAKDSIARVHSHTNDTQPTPHSIITLDPLKIGHFRLSGEVHQWMYDRYSLHKLLQETGFNDVNVCRADESRIPDFNSYLLDIEMDGSTRKPSSLFIEAFK